MLRLENLSSAEFTAAMRQEGILVRDCSNYPGLDRFHVRVAVKGRRENERLLAAALEVCS
jgi:threonine-phosphate decarboxylase